MAIIDPPREEAVVAVATCQKAGVCVKMITGDSPITAAAIGNKLGIQTDLVLTGQALDRMSTQEIRDNVLKCNIYARMSPENKLQIIQALLHHKKVTAMTGKKKGRVKIACLRTFLGLIIKICPLIRDNDLLRSSSVYITNY